MQYVNINRIRVLTLSLYGPNRGRAIVDAQKRVFDHFGFTINQVECPFPANSHGYFLDQTLRGTEGQWDALFLFDMDAIPLRPDFYNVALNKISDGLTVYGGAQQSNHIVKSNGTAQNVYVSPCFFAISNSLYDIIGRPSFDHGSRGDTAEEITWRTKEIGGTVALVYPSDVVDRCYSLDNGLSFGQGTTYGNMAYHNYCQDRPESEQMFVKKCEEVIGAKAD